MEDALKHFVDVEVSVDSWFDDAEELLALLNTTMQAAKAPCADQAQLLLAMYRAWRGALADEDAKMRAVVLFNETVGDLSTFAPDSSEASQVDRVLDILYEHRARLHLTEECFAWFRTGLPEPVAQAMVASLFRLFQKSMQLRIPLTVRKQMQNIARAVVARAPQVLQRLLSSQEDASGEAQRVLQAARARARRRLTGRR